MTKSDLKGQIQGIQLEAILQLAQMEQLTCTMVVSAPPHKGEIFVRNGQLIDAQVGSDDGSKAALTILMWDDAQVEIQESCDRSEVRIKHSVMALLTEAAKRKDDRDAAAAESPEPAPPAPAAAPEPPPPPPLSLADTPLPPPPASDAPMTMAESPELPPPPPDASVPGSFDDLAIPPIQEHVDNKQFPIKTIAVSVVILAVLAVAGYFGYAAYKAKRDYADTMARVAQTTAPEEKIRFLEAYLDGRDTNDYTVAARKALIVVTQERMATALDTALADASALVQRNAYAKAIERLDFFDKEFLGHDFKDPIQEKRAEIASAYEAFDYRNLTTAGRRPIFERVEQYHQFVVRHPTSQHHEATQAILAKAEKPYYSEVEKRIAAAVKAKNWSDAQKWVQAYRTIYPHGKHSTSTKKLDRLFSKNIKELALFNEVEKAVASAGNDLITARAVLADHLSAYPDTHLKTTIERRIAQLDTRLYDQRITTAIQSALTRVAPFKKRFQGRADGTLVDTRTKLMWTILDGATDRNECLSFEEAAAYIEDLTVGGHKNWRMPTPKELKALHDALPALKGAAPNWYWTSALERRYAGGWVVQVDVVKTGGPTESDEDRQKYSTECGNLRAVRRAGR